MGKKFWVHDEFHITLAFGIRMVIVHDIHIYLINFSLPINRV
jgi:hypothetical protein